jgi:beta-lactamase regulating signal transducer with metallopeptidase domain
VIAAFVVYSLGLGAFAAAAARLFEVTLSSYGRARRGVWIAAIVATVVLPPVATLLQEPRPPLTAPGISSAPRTSVTSQVAGALSAAPRRDARRAAWPVDEAVAMGWMLSSAAFLSFHLIGAWRLHRRSRDWQPAHLHAQAVSISQDIGPALYGWWRPRVVFPAWLLTAPATTQQLALAHEREHLSVRDPQVLAAATILTALMPWNAPLLWMLRRLRFAMEVDCDARVVRAGADPADYGLALLFVSERQARAPIATMALIERPSQLERRINIMVRSPRRRVFIAGACVALASSCVLAATQLDAPARIATSPIKLPPGPGPSLRAGQAVERLAHEKYPELLRGEFDGSPVLVVLLNADYSVAKSERLGGPTAGEQVSVADFQAIGLAQKDVPYVGATWMALPDQPGRGFLAAFTEAPAKAGERFVSKLFPDTRAIDRQVFEHYFDAATRGAIPAGESPWMLLDRNGHVLRTGVRSMTDADGFPTWLASQYPGVQSQEMTVTPLTDPEGNAIEDLGGNDLNLFSVWLAPGSPAPAN